MVDELTLSRYPNAMALEHDSDSPLAAAVRIAGSQSAFGRLIGKRQSVVHDWLRDSKPLPAEFVLTVEHETGISRHDLRPDIYPIESSGPSSRREAVQAAASKLSAAGDHTSPLAGARS